MCTDNRARAFVVDAKHTDRVSQFLICNFDSLSITGKHRTCQSVLRCGINERAYVLEATWGGIIVCLNCEKGTKELFAHQIRFLATFFGFEDGRLDKIPLAAICVATVD